MSAASTSSAEPEVRCDKARSGSGGEPKRRRGSTVVSTEGPLIFSARSGELGSSCCGGVLEGEERAFVWEKVR